MPTHQFRQVKTPISHPNLYYKLYFFQEPPQFLTRVLKVFQMLHPEPTQLANVTTIGHLTHRQCLKNKSKTRREDMESLLEDVTRQCRQALRKKCRQESAMRRQKGQVHIERGLTVVTGRLMSMRVDGIGRGSEHHRHTEVGASTEIEEEDPGECCHVAKHKFSQVLLSFCFKVIVDATS